MFDYGVALLFSGIATLIALDHYLPRTDPTSDHPLMPFIGIYGITATGVPIFTYLAQVVPLHGRYSFALFIGIGTIVMVLPLIVIENRAHEKRRNRTSVPENRSGNWPFWNRQRDE